MKPVHMEATKDEIAQLCIMPGDPLRAKYIADNFLSDVTLVNDVRNMYAYTGYYKGKRITVMAHGMGIPSIGIYSYELYHFYDVEKIIRIGTCGSNRESIKVLDIILSSGCSSISNFARTWGNCKDQFIKASASLNQTILDTAKELNQDVKFGPTFTSDVFDGYCDISHILDRDPLKNEILAKEMEGFGLMHIANIEGKEASMLLTVVDSEYEPENTVSADDRETSLNNMIILALESIIK